MTPEFRVWNKETNKYATGTRLFGFVESDDSSKFTLISLLSGVIEWYTGLKDKNGNKIFEGDIVRVLDGNGDGYIAPIKYMIADNYPAFDIDVRYVPINWYYLL